jgi:hypothetical protein
LIRTGRRDGGHEASLLACAKKRCEPQASSFPPLQKT